MKFQTVIIVPVPSPRLTVVIPVRDAGRYLRPAVLSALRAGVTDAEVVLADDGTTDGSLATVADLPARVVPVPGRGEAAARNAGVRAAAGRFVTFLDADDLLVAGGLAPRVERLEAEPALRAAGGLPSALIDEDGALLAPVFERMAAKLSFPFALDTAYYRGGNFFPVSCSLFVYRREAFTELGGYDETLAAAPDADFHFRLLARGPVPVLRARAFDRRLHRDNFSLSGADRGARAFRPEILDAIRAVNRRHGLEAAEIVPWENDYL